MVIEISICKVNIDAIQGQSIKSNIVLHKSILRHPKFQDGTYTTQFLEKNFELIEPELFKEVDDHGFVFFTNYQSRKGQELEHMPHASLLFHWSASKIEFVTDMTIHCRVEYPNGFIR